MKKILIVGAGQWQVPAILRAKELGYYTLATDRNPLAPGFSLADAHKQIDTTNLEKTCRYAEENSIDGVMTAATDFAVPTVAYISEKLGYPGISLGSALLCANKYLVREKLAANGLSAIAYGRLKDPRDIEAISQRVKWPVVVKPVDNCGSKKVVLAGDAGQMLDALQSALGASHAREAIYEGFIDGREISVEGLVYDKQAFIAAITDKEVTKPPYFVETGHTIPASLTKGQREHVFTFVDKVVRVLGLDFTAFHMELKVSGDSVEVVEIGARLGGGTITSDLVPLATGIDLLGEVIKMSAGEIPVVSPRYDRAAAVRFFITSTGTLEKVDGLDEAGKISGVRKVVLTAREKDKVSSLRSSDDRIGYVVCGGDTRKDAMESCDKAIAGIKLWIQ